MSTSTLPGSSRATGSEVTRRGARAPCSSTAPITRSASVSVCSSSVRVETAVEMREPNRSCSARSRSTSLVEHGDPRPHPHRDGRRVRAGAAAPITTTRPAAPRVPHRAELPRPTPPAVACKAWAPTWGRACPPPHSSARAGEASRRAAPPFRMQSRSPRSTAAPRCIPVRRREEIGEQHRPRRISPKSGPTALHLHDMSASAHTSSARSRIRAPAMTNSPSGIADPIPGTARSPGRRGRAHVIR